MRYVDNLLWLNMEVAAACPRSLVMLSSWLQEGIKAKKNLATDKTADELNAIFEPGQEFGFDATLELEDDSADEVAKPEAADASEIEVVGA